jgi:hypothetical protein
MRSVCYSMTAARIQIGAHLAIFNQCLVMTVGDVWCFVAAFLHTGFKLKPT